MNEGVVSITVIVVRANQVKILEFELMPLEKAWIDLSFPVIR